MVTIALKNGTTVIPTSFHGCRFSDGTVFDPTPEEIAQIRSDWSCLQVERTFKKVALRISGVKATKSSSHMTEDGVRALYKVSKEYPEAIILVSVMVLDALDSDNYLKYLPLVLAANATKETCRAAPQDKIWDLDNFSAGRY